MQARRVTKSSRKSQKQEDQTNINILDMLQAIIEGIAESVPSRSVSRK